ncbi:thiol-disulfide oxidoreductase DCC family protein [Calidithermus timidus]|jgi:predicted DCC family thiol-disulfide oxidoreductase YuxK|uniref:thiol-disulfide oxidoreductase DCC family protein n=1 Tax=Calidithermus timidus TaxID=307124 RepID=UPI000374D6F8|nr:thiol-disulfide oxidoreductase DCC family protein [Calidithermus timidus]
MKTIVLFDGVCNLCNGIVRFIVRCDPQGRFRFASQQSEVGRELLRKHGLLEAQSIVVLEGGRVYLESDAALHIFYRLGGAWRLLCALRVIPKPLRDRAYRFVAGKRYRLFGRLEQCATPTPELRRRCL